MLEVVEKILTFLADHLPSILVAVGLGYKIGRGKTRAIELKGAQMELENALLKNKETVRTNNAGLTDNDIIDDAIRKGTAGSMPNGDGSGGAGEV